MTPVEPTPPAEGSVLRILIVDDDLVDRMSVRRGLQAAGLELQVEEVDGCEAARRRLAAAPFDCVFLDYLLPDGTGLAVIQAARGAGLRCPLIVLTGQGDEQTAVELMKAGATDYLPKAHATPERLAQCVRNALRVQRAEQQALLAERERTRALVQERRARGEAEAAQRRLAFLAEASTLASSSLDYETTLENVARLAVPSLADWCFVDLLEEDGAYMRMAVAHAEPAHASLARRLRRRYAGMPEAPHGVSRVIATGQSEVMTEAPDWVLVALARDGEHLEMMRELKPASIMTVPLAARGRTLGAMTFLSSGASRYTLDDLAFAEEIARRAALAVDNALLFQEARRAEQRLRQQLHFTTAITGSLAEGVCALDRDGRVSFANPAAASILARSASDLLGLRLHDAIHPPGCRGCALLAATTTGAVTRTEEDAFVRPDGTSVPVSYVASPILATEGPSGLVLAFHDITERRRAEAELEASRRQLMQNEKLSALGTLVSGVAHELRTPLTYLTNNLFLLQARLDAAARDDATLAPLVADVRRFSQAAMDGVDRINALVKDLRPFAHAEGGHRVRASLHEVVAGAVDLFRATQRGRVEVEPSLAPTPPVLLDRGQVQRVVINLLVNAADAMPLGGRVRVSTRAEGAEAILEVEDQGSGIPPDVERRMFDPFFTTKSDGTGLGLAITRRIVESHGGRVEYRTRMGHGTTFTIAFPVAEASARTSDRPLTPTTP